MVCDQTEQETGAAQAFQSSYFPQGYSCPSEDMRSPTSMAGWYVVEETVPSLYCSAAMQKERSVCPAAWPCYPLGSCLGENTCDTRYTGERCATCSEDSVRVNGHCSACTTAYFALVLLVVTVVAFAAVLYKHRAALNTTQTVYCVYTGLDHLQLFGLLAAVSDLSAPDVVEYVLDTLTVFNLSPAFLLNDCFGLGQYLAPMKGAQR